MEWALSLTKPILATKPADPTELPLVVGHKHMTERNCLGSNEQIVRADRFAALLKTNSDQSIRMIGRCVERQNFEDPENCGELRGESWRSFLYKAVTQFCGNNDAGANLGFPNLSDVLRYTSLGIADEVRDDIGIEQIAH